MRLELSGENMIGDNYVEDEPGSSSGGCDEETREEVTVAEKLPSNPNLSQFVGGELMMTMNTLSVSVKQIPL
ncbi:hypothetical protein F2P81_023247 [Scophthalmus maximus]|uniref:Uncharacterized protein n=1 Tax=Scophthalmus maximus TaxID=52904 RepID=A0A6A4RW73_SCOMX|nr:hypothetical protein F2P81_023247 [Scophthalmus maximus]